MNAHRLLKHAFLRTLFCLPHNNIYEFHHVSADPACPQSPRRLATDSFYRFVDAHGPYLPLRQLLAQKALNGSAAITFDDGLEDVYTLAYPYLKERGIPFTVFVLSEKLGQAGYLTVAQLRELAADSLVVIGSHGTDHTVLAEASVNKQRHELFASRAQLEQLTGLPCAYFAYPLGAYNKTTLSLIRQAGYERAFAVKGRPLLAWNAKESYTIPRLSIADETLAFYDRS